MTSSVIRTAVVTGAASGIGAAITRRLVHDGWSVIGLDRSPAKPIDGVRFHVVDLSDAAAIDAVCEQIEDVDALVHAAGFMITGAADELDISDGDRMYAVHVRAIALLVRNLSKSMGSNGRIVAIGSRTSRGAKGKAQYAATKAALTGLVRSYAIEFATRGITANIVSPAATATAFLTSGDRVGVPPVMPPIGRYIEPDEVAGAVSFLLGADAGAITGQDILICGGASL